MTNQKVIVKKEGAWLVPFAKVFLPKTQIKFIVSGTIITILMAYDSRYGDFAALRLGDLILGGAAGLAVSLAIDGASGAVRLMAAKGHRSKKMTPFQQQRPGPSKKGSRTVRLHDGRQMDVGTGSDFEYALPSGGGYITMRSKRDLFWALFGRFNAVPPPPSPPSRLTRSVVVDSDKFESYDRDGQEVQLQKDDVERFLDVAWRYNTRGSGLGRNRWSGKRYPLPAWYKGKGIGWYWAMLNLMADAEEITGTQLVRVVRVSAKVCYLVLLMNNYQTYEVLEVAENLKEG